ncbi:hypothetical protein O0S10_06730 [Methanocorpusculum sp. MG]|uniref:Uncharacterized protein n=1 Tax=Methanocorpusculum petauri TaxID=3002863 RepID=A0ABT4IGP9_9EURY|nr:hypothetical protein [Methanocorpusculum petauri]MCZ0860920.1 hypothetical protein [Methanocorpusculum petauri]
MVATATSNRPAPGGRERRKKCDERSRAVRRICVICVILSSSCPYEETRTTEILASRHKPKTPDHDTPHPPRKPPMNEEPLRYYGHTYCGTAFTLGRYRTAEPCSPPPLGSLSHGRAVLRSPLRGSLSQTRLKMLAKPTQDSK